VLLVYALIKRPFVLDMQKGRSVIEFLTRAGFDVFLTDWIPPTAADTWRGFDAYVNGDLKAAMRAVRALTGADEVTILGYCFGALLSLAYAALNPEGVRNLITATVPFDLSVRELPIYSVVERMTDDAVELMTRIYGNCPAWMVQSFFTAMAPAHHAIGKYGRSRAAFSRKLPGASSSATSSRAASSKSDRALSTSARYPARCSTSWRNLMTSCIPAPACRSSNMLRAATGAI
jgi:poly(3-hydroxyalkanoate) synthetase